MPPPPPPSKSYLLNFTDSDLEDDENEDEDSTNISHEEEKAERLDNVEESTQATMKRNNDSSSSAATTTTSISTSRTSSKSKKKRKKKKKKKGSPNTTTITAASSTPKKQVSFGDVRIRAFERSFYSDGVPSDGGWPLGFHHKEYTDEPEPIAIETYEQDKQDRLVERWRTVRPDETIPTAPLETRQWDFKFGIKNPLFKALAEKTRRQVILGLPPQKKATANNSSSSSSSSSSSAQKSPNTRSRSRRANSFSEQNHQRRRSDSKTTAEENPLEFEARHVQMELEQLRTERSRQGAKGCTCKKLHVYIPPPNAGKKAAHRRMNVQKVKEELRNRNALPETAAKQGSREDLERLLLQLVQKEPCCGPDCECVAAGIECQDDACSCWWAAHHHVKDSLAKLPPAVVRERCGNPNGMVTVDFEMIDQNRRPYLTCQLVTNEISSDDSSTTPMLRKTIKDDRTDEEKKIEGAA